MLPEQIEPRIIGRLGENPSRPLVVKLDMSPTWVTVDLPSMCTPWVTVGGLGVTDVGNGGVTDVGNGVLPTWVMGFCFWKYCRIPLRAAVSDAKWCRVKPHSVPADIFLGGELCPDSCNVPEFC